MQVRLWHCQMLTGRFGDRSEAVEAAKQRGALHHSQRSSWLGMVQPPRAVYGGDLLRLLSCLQSAVPSVSTRHRIMCSIRHNLHWFTPYSVHCPPIHSFTHAALTHSRCARSLAHSRCTRSLSRSLTCVLARSLTHLHSLTHNVGSIKPSTCDIS